MPKKILLADDSITIQKVIGLTFANEDVQLTVVDNGDEAMIKAKEIIPDLIIADVVMPGKDGYEVCYSTKADPALQHIPVLLLTGTFETFDEAMATKVGADGFITKPFESQSLIDKVNELIGRAATRKAPSINDLAGAGAQNHVSHDLDDPMNNIDSMDTMDAFEPVESMEPIEPMEALEPMELDEIAAVEENPMEEFASMTPDAAESSFADVSFDEPPAAESSSDEADTSFSDFDLTSAATEPEPEPVAPEPVAAAEDKPFVSSHVAVLSPDADWNMSGLNDYMAEGAAPAAPEAEVAAAPAAEFDAVETIDMEPQAAAPADIMEIDDQPSEMLMESTEPEISEMAVEPAAANEPISAESDVWNTPQNAIQSALAVENASFGDAPATDDAPATFDDAPADFEDAPVSIDDAPAVFGTETLAIGDPSAAYDEAPVAFDEAPVAFTPAAQESVGPTAEEYTDDPVAEEVAPAAAAPAPVELSDVDGSMELTPLATNPNPTLDQVADMYPLDDAPVAATEERPLAASGFDTQPVIPVAPPTAAPVVGAVSISGENFEIQSQRLSEMIESRVRATLADDKVLSAFSDQASRLVEAKIEEAINKVAPQVIEQLVRKALQDATEKILNETIGRLRNP